MRNNIKVAQALLERGVGGSQTTISAVSEAAGVRYMDAQTFLKTWKALGWLTTARGRGSTLLYSVTEQGVIGLTKLIERHANDRDIHWFPLT